jgi:hypothetical protein
VTTDRRRGEDRRAKPSPGRRGRPPLSPDEPSTAVGGLKLPNSLFDRTCAAARDQQISVPEVIRRALARDLERQTRQT